MNNELSVAFTRAFAYEHCKTVKEENNPEMYMVAWVVIGEASRERCRKMGELQQKMIRFWCMVVDDATVDSQQIPKETPHRHILKANLNDTGETLITDMLKNVHEACETLEATKSALEKATLAHWR